MSTRSFSFTLRTLLLIYCTVVTLLLTTALLFLHSRLFEQYAVDRLTAHGKAITLNTAFFVADDLITENYAALQDFALSFAARADIEALLISDQQWQIITSSEPELLGTTMEKFPPGVCLLVDGDFNVRLSATGERLCVTSPVIIGRQTLGHVRVMLSTTPMLARLHQLQRQGIMIGASFWFLAMLGGYLMARRLTGPLRQFMTATESIRQGDFQVEIPSGRPIRELHGFALTLRRMAATIGRRERELAKMRNYLHNIIESMPSSLVTINDQGEITQWNGAATEFTGIPTTKALGRNLYEIVPLFSRYAERLAESNRSRQPVTLHRERLEGEKEQFCNLTFFPLMANGVDGMVIRLDDITEMEKKEQQLRQAQKMETIGTLAGGLAHDFNNVLTGIMGNLSLLRFKQKSGQAIESAELAEYLGQMETAGKRATDMVRQLLTLARRQETRRVPVDLLLTIKHVRAICETTFDRSVRLVVQVAPKLRQAMVMGDPTEIEQTLLNLCVNALHAMTFMRAASEWGGTISIKLTPVEIGPDLLHRPEIKPGSYWRLAVNDTGIGMDREIREKIFLPFFTTKERHEGTGLGLAMVESIVRQHNGHVMVYSEPDLGSTFSIYLPRMEQADQTENGEENIPAIEPGSGLILVVDDDPVVRQLAEEALKILGYQVLTAADGLEALEVYRQHQAEIRAVLLDMAMPVMSGREAFLELQKINPEILVVMSSGFRQDERLEEVMQRGARAFLQKPYDLTSLAQTMAHVLRS
ncbi:response regulator [Desulfurivibrio sp. D14AmB]|uniref:response regulator n=1 Tax=Desulfurivibrio sp. D14AmB TaxID=3374370 RepID=UPI00376F0559